MSVRTLAGAASLAGLMLLVQGCGGGDRADRPDTGAAAPPAAEAPAQAPGGQQPAPEPGPQPAGGAGAGPTSPQMIALGDSIFHGQAAGGTCTACHGQDAKGTPVGPDLTDNEWLNTDGTFEGIVKVIRSGVPTPKKAPAPMPPMGGSSLTDEQVQAVAAYVYSLSHKS